VVQVRPGEQVATLILPGKLDAAAHPGTVLGYRYQPSYQRVLRVVAANGDVADDLGRGAGLPSEAPTDFSIYDRGGELLIFFPPVTAAGDRYQNLYVVTQIEGEQGWVTTSTEVLGVLRAGRLEQIGETCRTGTSLVIGPGETVPRPGAVPLDDVPGQPF
jgi:hypothetical protein